MTRLSEQSAIYFKYLRYTPFLSAAEAIIIRFDFPANTIIK